MSEVKKSEPTAEPTKVEAVSKNPEPTPSTNTQTSPPPTVIYVEKKGGFGFGKCCLVGCVALLLCCICTIVFALIAPRVLVTTIIGGNRAPDPSLTRVLSLSEFKQLELTQAGDFLSGSQVVLKEKDTITMILTNFGINSAANTATEENVKKIGVKFTPGNAVVEIDLGLVASMFKSSNTAEVQNFDPKIFDGINFSVTLGTSPDGKTLVINNFSTGNTILDSIIPAEFKANLMKSVQDKVAEFLTGESGTQATFEKIEFRQGELMLEVKIN